MNIQPTSISELTYRGVHSSAEQGSVVIPQPSESPASKHEPRLNPEDILSLRTLRLHLADASEERIHAPVARLSPKAHRARRWLRAFDRLTGGRFK